MIHTLNFTPPYKNYEVGICMHCGKQVKWNKGESGGYDLRRDEWKHIKCLPRDNESV